MRAAQRLPVRRLRVLLQRLAYVELRVVLQHMRAEPGELPEGRRRWRSSSDRRPVLRQGRRGLQREHQLHLLPPARDELREQRAVLRRQRVLRWRVQRVPERGTERRQRHSVLRRPRAAQRRVQRSVPGDGRIVHGAGPAGAMQPGDGHRMQRVRRHHVHVDRAHRRDVQRAGRQLRREHRQHRAARVHDADAIRNLRRHSGLQRRAPLRRRRALRRRRVRVHRDRGLPLLPSTGDADRRGPAESGNVRHARLRWRLRQRVPVRHRGRLRPSRPSSDDMRAGLLLRVQRAVGRRPTIVPTAAAVRGTQRPLLGSVDDPACHVHSNPGVHLNHEVPTRFALRALAQRLRRRCLTFG